ncbi:MAG: DUF983 domain-containing protein [Rickettsiales bacterium]
METRSLLAQLLRPRCPRCGVGPLFKSPLQIVDQCGCGLVLKHHDSADGPAFFAITIVGFLVMGLAAFVEYHFAPPLWLHALIWVPFTFIACIVVLRIFKTLLVTLEYRLALLKEKSDDPLP